MDLSPRSASGNLPPELRCFYSKNNTSDLFCELSSDSLPENSERNPPVLQVSHQLVLCAVFCGEDGRRLCLSGSVCRMETGRPICPSGLERNQPRSRGVMRGKGRNGLFFIDVRHQLTRHNAWIWGTFSDTKARRAEPDWRALGCEGTDVELAGNNAQRLRRKTERVLVIGPSVFFSRVRRTRVFSSSEHTFRLSPPTYVVDVAHFSVFG